MSTIFGIVKSKQGKKRKKMEKNSFSPQIELSERLKRAEKLEQHLQTQIIGQDIILPAFSRTIRYGWCQLNTPGRPRGTMFLLGPTGTGKTESVRAAVEFMYGDPDSHFLRLDMSEFSRQAGEEALINLIGAPGGKSQGRLGDFLQENSEGVILYDEIEKSHPQIFTILLQQLDAARITLSNNRTYDLSNFFLIATSNIGAHIFQHVRHLSTRRLEQSLEMQLKERFSPEFVARFGKMNHEILIFRPLQPEHLRKIAAKFLNYYLPQYRSHGIDIQGYSSDVIEEVLRSIDNTRNGARELRSTIERQLRDFAYRILTTEQLPVSGCLDVSPDSSGLFQITENPLPGKEYHHVD